MGVGIAEGAITPARIIAQDLEMISLENMYTQPVEDNNTKGRW